MPTKSSPEIPDYFRQQQLYVLRIMGSPVIPDCLVRQRRILLRSERSPEMPDCPTATTTKRQTVLIKQPGVSGLPSEGRKRGKRRECKGAIAVRTASNKVITPCTESSSTIAAAVRARRCPHSRKDGEKATETSRQRAKK